MDFGKVQDWNSPVAEFRFTNTGNKEAFFLPQHYQRDVGVEQPVYPVRPGVGRDQFDTILRNLETLKGRSTFTTVGRKRLRY